MKDSIVFPTKNGL